MCQLWCGIRISRKNYGSVLSCPYCKTEYHIDKLGKFDEYKIEFEYMGKKVKGYISDVKFKKLWGECEMDVRGRLMPPQPIKTFLEFDIIGEFVDE